MLVATTEPIQGTDQKSAKVIGYFDFPDQTTFTHLVIQRGDETFRFPICAIPFGEETHRVAIFGEMAMTEIRQLVPTLIPIQVNTDVFLPSNGSPPSPIFQFS